VGSTLTTWSTQVASLVRDASGVDVSSAQARDVGVIPALAQYSIDRPRTVVVDITRLADRYSAIPTPAQGWSDNWSQVTRVEVPAGQTPPQPVDFEMTRDPSTPATQRILLPEGTGTGAVRVFFTAPWPTPTTDPAVDLVSPVGFSAVTSLAAAMVLLSMAAEASRSRQGALATDFVDGSDRTRDFLDVAAGLRVVYNTFIGLGQVAGQTPSASDRQLRSTKIDRPPRVVAW
jgi:hypothetical protein